MKYVIFTLIGVLVLVGLRYVILESLAYSYITNHMEHIKSSLKYKELSIDDSWSGNDASTSEAKWAVTGDQIRIVRGNLGTLLLVRAVMRDQINLHQLQLMSDTPSVKLPRFL